MSCCQESYLPVNFDVFLPIVTGDTYPEGIRFTEDGIDQVLTAVEIEFKSNPAMQIGEFTLSTGNGGITMDSTAANNWDVSVPAFLVSLSAGDYFYQIKFTYGTGKVITLVSGTLTVEPSI